MIKEQITYELFVTALVGKKYEEAKAIIAQGVSCAKESGNSARLSGLARDLGQVLYEQGDVSSALLLYELSEEIDKNSLPGMLSYATFLLISLKDMEKTIKKCREIIKLAKKKPFYKTPLISSERYIKEANQLLKEAEERLS